MLYEEQMPPVIRVFLGDTIQKLGDFAIPIMATNNGTETAENVIIEIILEGASEEEISQMTFAYLPRKSSANGWIIFSRRPLPENLKTRVLATAFLEER